MSVKFLGSGRKPAYVKLDIMIYIVEFVIAGGVYDVESVTRCSEMMHLIEGRATAFERPHSSGRLP